MFRRHGHDDYPLVGWNKVQIGDAWVYDGPKGQRSTNVAKAFDQHMSSKVCSAKDKDSKDALTILGKFLQDNLGTAQTQTDEQIQDQRRPVVITTSTLEDYLWRGDDPLVKDMSLQVYAMWVYRIEKPPIDPEDDHRPPRHIECDLSTDYKLHRTHLQRFSSELRVPMFQGYTLSPSTTNREDAYMYKQLLTRALAVPIDERPVDRRLIASFAPMCAPQAPTVDLTLLPKSEWARVAFYKSWEQFSKTQTELANEGKRRFLERFEFPSLHETQEVHDYFEYLYDDSVTDLSLIHI